MLEVSLPCKFFPNEASVMIDGDKIAVSGFPRQHMLSSLRLLILAHCRVWQKRYKKGEWPDKAEKAKLVSNILMRGISLHVKEY